MTEESMFGKADFSTLSDDEVYKIYLHRRTRNDNLIEDGWTDEHLFFRNDVKLLNEALEELIIRANYFVLIGFSNQ